MPAHEAYVWMKEVTSSNSWSFGASCHRESEKSCFYFLWNHPKSVMHVRRILWSVRLIIFIPYVYPSTPSHWLTCSRKRSLCLGSNPWTCVKTLISLMMVPNQNSIVFMIRLLRGHACLGQRVHRFVAEPALVLELAIVVHLPRIPQHYLVEWCCKLPFFFLDSMSLEYHDTNQIWISGRYDGWNISQEL